MMIQTISTVKVVELLKKGCQGILAAVLDKKETELKIEDIVMVNEYLDVFPEELPGLRQDREIEFFIDLFPRSSPISKSPYRMGLTEMKELNDQLQELQDNEFIRPSTSTWGASILFVKKKDGSMRLCLSLIHI